MLRRIAFGSALAALLLAPAALMAQDEAPTSYVYGIYYYCDVTKQELADHIVKTAFKPGYDAAVEAGEITSWGWMAHHTGGQWRRLLYFAAPTTDALMDALESTGERVDKDFPMAGRDLGEICGAHDDYIWQAGTGSAGAAVPEQRGEAGFSVYMKCDMTKEGRADEIVKETFAPIYNRHVKEGNIQTWGWLQHFVGGEWRRLSTMTGKDHKSLLKARDAIIAEIYEKNQAIGEEFDQICSAHQDYMWDIVAETP